MMVPAIRRASPPARWRGLFVALLAAALLLLLWFPVKGKLSPAHFRSKENPLRLHLPGGEPLALAPIPGGRYRIGSPEGRAQEKPREVDLGPFYIGIHEITVGQFAAFLRASEIAYPDSPQLQRGPRGWQVTAGQKRFPAAWISYEEACAFCSWLREASGHSVRLPEEAEWEVAARGPRKRGRYPWGWKPPAGRACFQMENAQRVGSFPANRYGLYDMAGNVFEWCAGGTGSSTALRGGAWPEQDPALLTVFRRTLLPATYRDADVGFRVLIEAE